MSQVVNCRSWDVCRLCMGLPNRRDVTPTPTGLRADLQGFLQLKPYTAVQSL